MNSLRLRFAGLAFTLLIALTLSGCASIRSTHVERNPFDCGWVTRHLRGVPTKIRVPTHLEVAIYETRYLRKSNGNTVYIPNISSFRVETNIIEKEEIFTVDPVRPAAGLGASVVTLNEKNSISNIKGKVDDQTLAAITYSISKLTGGKPDASKFNPDLTKVFAKLPDPPKSNPPQPPTATKTDAWPMESLVAAQWFDLSDPLLEMKVQEFLHVRLNGCQEPCAPPREVTWPQPPAPAPTSAAPNPSAVPTPEDLAIEPPRAIAPPGIDSKRTAIPAVPLPAGPPAAPSPFPVQPMGPIPQSPTEPDTLIFRRSLPN